MKNLGRAFLLLLIVVMVGCSNDNVSEADNNTQSDTEEPAEISVAYHPHLVGLGPLIIAEEKGFFEEENLDVNLVEFTSGSVELQAMASGEIDLGYLGVGAHVFAPQGQAVILSLDSTDISSEIMTPADSGIESVANLKGKTVAITAGTTSDLALSLALERNDLEETDVTRSNMDAAAKVAAFMSDQIDAIAIESPYTDQIRDDLGEDQVVTLQTSEDFLPEAVFTNSWVTTPDFLENNEDVTYRFLRALIRGIDYRYHHMDESIDLVADYLDADAQTIGQLEEKTNWIDADEIQTLYNDGTAEEWYGKMIDMFLDAELLEEQYDVPTSDFVNSELVLEAIESLQEEGLLE